MVLLVRESSSRVSRCLSMESLLLRLSAVWCTIAAPNPGDDSMFKIKGRITPGVLRPLLGKNTLPLIHKIETGWIL